MHKKRNVGIFLILFFGLGVFLRFYKIGGTFMFQGDQGRDAIVVKRMLYDRDLTLLGPVTSVGNMYLGPLYYYFMAPFLAFTFPNPVGPVIGVAILDVATLVLIYFVGKEIFDKRVGLFGLAIYSVMNVAILYSRFSWNPNLGSFFGLLVFWFMARLISKRKAINVIYALIAFAALIQMHYVALLAGVVVVAGWLMAFFSRIVERKDLFVKSLAGIILLLLSTLPLVAFDFLHDHLIWKGFFSFFENDGGRMQTLSAAMQVVKELEGKSFRILGQLMGTNGGLVDRLVVYPVILLSAYIMLFAKLDRKMRMKFILLLSWVGGAIVGVSFYADTVFDHYLSFIFAGLAILYGFLSSWLWSKGNFAKMVVAVLLLVYGYVNLGSTPAFGRHGLSADYYREVVYGIVPDIPEEYSYNLVLLAENKDYKGMNYRYFFEVSDHKPEGVDAYEYLDYLVIIDELGVDNPLEYQIYEIQTQANITLVKHERIDNRIDYYLFKIEKVE